MHSYRDDFEKIEQRILRMIETPGIVIAGLTKDAVDLVRYVHVLHRELRGAEETMQEEIRVAVDWWKAALRAPTHDNGDAMQSAMATVGSKLIPPLEEEKIEKFGAELARRLPGFLIEDGWIKALQDPGWGNRWIGTDYGPQGVLSDAAEAAGITSGLLRFPMKTGMWIDPGEVKVAGGYKAAVETIWKAENKEKVRS